MLDRASRRFGLSHHPDPGRRPLSALRGVTAVSTVFWGLLSEPGGLVGVCQRFKKLGMY